MDRSYVRHRVLRQMLEECTRLEELGIGIHACLLVRAFTSVCFRGDQIRIASAKNPRIFRTLWAFAYNDTPNPDDKL